METKLDPSADTPDKTTNKLDSTEESQSSKYTKQAWDERMEKMFQDGWRAPTRCGPNGEDPLHGMSSYDRFQRMKRRIEQTASWQKRYLSVETDCGHGEHSK